MRLSHLLKTRLNTTSSVNNGTKQSSPPLVLLPPPQASQHLFPLREALASAAPFPPSPPKSPMLPSPHPDCFPSQLTMRQRVRYLHSLPQPLFSTKQTDLIPLREWMVSRCLEAEVKLYRVTLFGYITELLRAGGVLDGVR